MTELHYVIDALERCKSGGKCKKCPYCNKERFVPKHMTCIQILMEDVLKHLDEYKRHEAERLKPLGACKDAPETPQPMTRERILARAKECVCGEREQDYGTPEDSFLRIANLWTAYMGIDFSPADVTAMMGLLKIARIAGNPKHMDNWVDLAGYAACGGEISDKN